MDETEITFSLSALGERTEEQVEEILNVLEQIKPIQCEILGDKTVREISKGAAFESVEGGRHVNFLETITLLSGIAALTQFAMVIISSLRSKLQNRKEGSKEVQEEAQRIIIGKMSIHDELSNLRNLIVSDPVLLGRVVSILLAENKPEKSD